MTDRAAPVSTIPPIIQETFAEYMIGGFYCFVICESFSSFIWEDIFVVVGILLLLWGKLSVR